MKSRRGNQRNGVKKKKNFAGNFIFWMTLIGLSMATFFALLAVTTITINFATTRIIAVWRPPAIGRAAATVRPSAETMMRLPPALPFTTFQMQGYVFDNPGNWRAQAKPTAVQLYSFNGNDVLNLLAVQNSRVTFSTPDGRTVAEMLCPIKETGYELSNATVENRQFERNGVMSTAILRFGQVNTQNPAYGQFTLIVIQPADKLGVFASCQIRSTEPGMVDQESFRRIYQSLR